MFKLLIIFLTTLGHSAEERSRLSCIDAFKDEVLAPLSDSARELAIEKRLEDSLAENVRLYQSGLQKHLALLDFDMNLIELAQIDRETSVKKTFELLETCSDDACAVILGALQKLDAVLEWRSRYKKDRVIKAPTAESDIPNRIFRNFLVAAKEGLGRIGDATPQAELALHRFELYFAALVKLDKTRARQQILAVSQIVLDSMAAYPADDIAAVMTQIARITNSHQITLHELLPAMLKAAAESQHRLRGAADPSWWGFAILQAQIVKAEAELQLPSSLAKSVHEYLDKARGMPFFAEDLYAVHRNLGFVLYYIEDVPIELAQATQALLEKWIGDIRILTSDAYRTPDGHTDLHTTQDQLAYFVAFLDDCWFPNQAELIALLRSACDLPYMGDMNGYDRYKPSKTSRIMNITSHWQLRKDRT